MLRVSTFILGLALSASAFAADPVFPPGSRIGLIPPGQMKIARAISGFQDPSTGAAIVTIEMPADAYPSIAAGFTDEALKTQGFTLKSRDTVKVGAGNALLISGTQSDAGRAVPKTILLAADPTLTGLVIGQLPVGAPQAAQEELRTALKSVAFRAPLSIDEQLAALPFRLADSAGFRPIRAMAGSSLLLTDGPNNVVRNAEQPILIVAQSFAPGPSAPDQRDAFARNALVANSLVKEPVLERSQSFRLGGADWHEIVAKAKDGPSEQPVIIMQTIRFAPDSYVRTVGVARPEQRDDLLPRFRRVVDGLVLK